MKGEIDSFEVIRKLSLYGYKINNYVKSYSKSHPNDAGNRTIANEYPEPEYVDPEFHKRTLRKFKKIQVADKNFTYCFFELIGHKNVIVNREGRIISRS